MSFYALGKYDEAAREYEQAFALKADSALLYNAAQAHRRAGNKARALTLYENYLAVFGAQVTNRKEVQRKIDELRALVEAEQHAKNAAPAEPEPMRSDRASVAAPAPVVPPPVTLPPPVAPRATAENRTLVETPPPPPHAAPHQRRVWMWGVVAGGVAAAALGIGLGVGLGGSTVAPTPNFGTVKVTPQ